MTTESLKTGPICKPVPSPGPAGNTTGEVGTMDPSQDSWQATSRAYDELRRLAQRYIDRERQDHTLQATAVVHEAFLRLANRRVGQWEGRAHFFNTAAREMRRVLIDYARRHDTGRRGSGWQRETLHENSASIPSVDIDLIALERSLESLEVLDQRKARVVELRFFAGLTLDETAEILGTSKATVVREWRVARAWLRSRMESPTISPGTAI